MACWWMLTWDFNGGGGLCAHDKPQQSPRRLRSGEVRDLVDQVATSILQQGIDAHFGNHGAQLGTKNTTDMGR